MLILKTQIILFKRYGAVLKDYKYAGYPLLQPLLEISEGESVYGDRATQLVVCTNLCFLTCANSTFNAQELIRSGGVETLSKLLDRAIVGHDTPKEDIRVQIALNLLKTFSGLAFYETARKIIVSSPQLVDNFCRFASLHHLPEIVQFALNTLARLCIDSKLQNRELVNVF